MPEPHNIASKDLEGLLQTPSQIESLGDEEKRALFRQLMGLLKSLEDSDVRENILSCLDILSKSYKPSGKDLELFKEECEKDFKKEMEFLIIKQNGQWAKLWKFMMQLLGCETHSSKGLLNSLLSVLEKAMKSKDNCTLVLAFNSWSILVDNFALNRDVLAAQRRVDLLTIPLKSKIAKEPLTMTAKFYTWWHLILKLESNIGKHYTGVLKPFFMYCYGPFSKDSLPNQLKLSKRVPQLAHDSLLSLTYALGIGVPEVENELHEVGTTLEIPQAPIFPEPSAFEIFYGDLTLAVADYLITLPDDKLTLLAFKALVHRIGQFHNGHDTAWQGAASELIQVLKKCIQSSETIKVYTLTTTVCDIILSTWDAPLLDSPINSVATTMREFLFKAMLQENIVIQNAKTSVEKHEDKYIKLIRTLLDRQGHLVAGPEIITDLAKLTDALERPESLTVVNIQCLLAKLMYMWDQFSKVVVKILPSESANEDCNEVCRKNLTKLLLCPLNLSIKHQTSSPNVTGLLQTWKQLFLKYVAVSALSLSLNKQDCGDEICEKMLELLQEGSFKVSTILTFVQFATHLVSIHPLRAEKTISFESTEELKVVKLLVREAILLEAAYLEDVTKASKASMLLAKTFHSLLIMQPTIITSLHILKGFYHILSSQQASSKQGTKNESIAEIWQIFTHTFTTDIINNGEVDSRELKAEIRDHLPLLERLKAHVNIKVVQAATLLESSFLEILNKPNTRLSIINKLEEPKNSPNKTVFAAPSQSQMSRKRPRKQSLVPNPSVAATFLTPTTSQPHTSPTVSPARSKPSLEEEDSQDFVKIAPKPVKSKKVLTPHQRESKRRRRDDIPALYQGLSQDTFNSQDTQDTQDNYTLISSGTPVSSSQIICLDEDAVDLDIQENLKTVPSSQTTPKKNENQVELMEEGEEEDEDDEEEVSLPNPFTPTKDQDDATASEIEMLEEDEVSSGKSELEKMVEEKHTTGVSSISKEITSTSSDDDVVFVGEAPTTHKLGVTPKKSDKENTMSDNVSSNPQLGETDDDSTKSTFEDSQDLIEDSQTLPIKETPVVKVAPVDIEIKSNKVTAIDNVRKQLRPSPSIQNRQGVTLPKRGTKILSDSSNKEKTSSPWQNRPIFGRAAQMLEMANSSKNTTETKSSPTSTVDNSATKDTLTILESKLLPNTSILPCSEETEKVGDTQAAAEKSPDKMNTVQAAVSTPLSSLGKSMERRSNLKKDNSSPSPKKFKRVSFAEPVVSSAKESPKILNEESTYTSLYRSPKSKPRNKSPKLSRKSLMPFISAENKCDGSGSSKNLEYSIINSEALTSQGSLPMEVPNSSDTPIFPALVGCEEAIDVIATKLSSPMLQTSIIEHLQDNNINTIGNLSSLSEISINNLSIKEPKIQTVKSVLMEYIAVVCTTVENAEEEPQESVKSETTEAPELLEPIPLIEEPQEDDDEPQSLDKELSKLMERYSVKQVLQAMGRDNEVFEHAMSLKVPQKVVNAVVAEQTSSGLLKKIGKVKIVADNISPQTEEIDSPHSSKQMTSSCSTSEVLKSLDNQEEILNYTITNSDPLVVIKKAAENQNISAVLSTLEKSEEVLNYSLENSDPLQVIQKLSDKISLLDVLNVLANDNEILDHSLMHVKPQDIMHKIKTQFEMSDIVETLNKDNELIEYIMKNTELSVLIEKATKNQSLCDLLDALQKPEEILNYTLSSCTSNDIMQKLSTKHSAGELLQAMDKNNDVLDHVLKNNQPETVISKLKAQVPVEKVVDALGDKDKVLEHILSEAGPLVAITRAADMLKGDELKVVVTSLDSKLQEEICKALPMKCVEENLKNILSTGSSKDKDTITNSVVHAASNTQIISEFVQRCSKSKTSLLNAEQSKKILDIIPLDLVTEKLNTILNKSDKVSEEVKNKLLQCITNTELVNKLTQDCTNNKLNFNKLESKQVMSLCNLLPLSSVVERVKSTLVKGEANEVAKIKNATLPYYSGSELLQHLASVQAEESEEAKAVRSNLLSLLMECTTTESILKSAESKIIAGESNRKINKAIESVASHLPKHMLINMLRKSELSDLNKHDLLDHLINLLPSQDTMSRLPIKDVILYYEKLITTPDYSASLMKTSFEKASSNDIIRFLGAEKIISLIKNGSISTEDFAGKISSDVLMSLLNIQLKSPRSSEVMKLLKTKFPRDKLGELVAQILTDSQ